MRRRILALGVACTLAAAAAHDARAQDDTATALALFEQGRALVSAGKLDEACPKLAASLKLVPKVATLLNLADCYERAGKTASAWARWTEAAAMADRQGQADRAATARQRAAALEPKLSKLTIAVPAAGASPAGLVVKRDGEAVDAAILGAPVPVDPGTHVVEASAPGKQPWSMTVQLGQGSAATVQVPALGDAGAAATPVPVPNPTSTPTPTPPETPSTGSSQRTIGLVVGGAGVAGVAAGAILGLMASSAKSTYEQHCGSNIGAPAGFCDAQGVSGHADASGKALASTVLFAVGGAAVAGGAVLFFTAPRGGAPAMGIGPGEIVLRGGF